MGRSKLTYTRHGSAPVPGEAGSGGRAGCSGAHLWLVGKQRQKHNEATRVRPLTGSPARLSSKMRLLSRAFSTSSHSGYLGKLLKRFQAWKVGPSAHVLPEQPSTLPRTPLLRDPGSVHLLPLPWRRRCPAPPAPREPAYLHSHHKRGPLSESFPHHEGLLQGNGSVHLQRQELLLQIGGAAPAGVCGMCR